jgi:hypothetical protein
MQGQGYFGSSGSTFGSSSQPQGHIAYPYNNGSQSGVGMGGQLHAMGPMHQHHAAAIAEVANLQLLGNNLGHLGRQQDFDGASSVNVTQLFQRLEAAQTSQNLMITTSLEKQSSAIAVSFESAALKLGEAIGEKLCEAMKGFGGSRARKGGRGNKRSAHSPTGTKQHTSSVTAESESASACDSSDVRVVKRARGAQLETRAEKAAKIANGVCIGVTEEGIKRSLTFPCLAETCKLLFRFCKFITKVVPVMNSIVKHYMHLFNEMELSDLEVATSLSLC